MRVFSTYDLYRCIHVTQTAVEPLFDETVYVMDFFL